MERFRWHAARILAAVVVGGASLMSGGASADPEPLPTQQAHLFKKAHAKDEIWGRSVAVDGDTLVIGALSRVYVFTRSGSTWTRQANLVRSDGFGSFGRSVAISGDTLVVGAPEDTVPGFTHGGSVYVFTRSGTEWTEQAHLVASDPTSFARFGVSVAVSGDTLVAGARWAPGPSSARLGGSAYVFTRSGTTWTQQAKLLASDGSDGDEFGSSVAISGDTAVVGAENDDIGSSTNAGSAYVFSRAGTSWTEQAHLVAGDAQAFDLFGTVAISGDTILVGDGVPNVAPTGTGSAYVFTRSGSTWTQEAELSVPGVGRDYFGSAVAISGDTAVVGAAGEDTAAGVDAGSIHFFTRAGSTWTHLAQLFATDPSAKDNFGASVAISGGTSVVGAVTDDTGPGGSDAGSVYVFVPDFDNDGDGIGDQADPDDDNDGIPDESDGYPTDPDGLVSGILSQVVAVVPPAEPIVSPVREIVQGLGL